MSEKVNIYDAKTRLSQLIDRVAAGEEIVIARSGRPVARLVPWRDASAQRQPGRLRRRVRIGRDFDDPLPSGLFEGDEK
jgi:prevent-host-death family protein